MNGNKVKMGGVLGLVCLVLVSTVEAAQTFSAVVRPSQVCTLALRVGGTLLEVGAKAGERVTEGDVLLRIDPRDFEYDVQLAAAHLQTAREQLAMLEHGARAEDIAILEARLQAAVAQRDYAASECERAEPLTRQNVISPSELDFMRSKLRVADATIASLQQERNKAKVGGRPEEIQIKKAEIARLEVALAVAKSQLADTTLKAPFSGILTAEKVQPHEIVRPGQAVVTLMDVSHLDLEISLSEAEIPKDGDFATHFHGTVSFPFQPDEKYPVTFKKIEPNANPETHQWQVTLTLKAPDHGILLPGMDAQVELE